MGGVRFEQRWWLRFERWRVTRLRDSGGQTVSRATAGRGTVGDARWGEREGRLRAVSGGGDGGRMGLAAETAKEVGGGFAEF